VGDRMKRFSVVLPSVVILIFLLSSCVKPTTVPIPSTTTQELVIGSTQVSPKDGMVMVFVPAGDFVMGSPEGEGNSDEYPQHMVTLDAYWIDQSEVTNGKYAQCVADGACTNPSVNSSSIRDSYYGNETYDNYPVIYVHWSDAKDYCSWAGRRLPTEAEWEKAARGSEGQIYPWGDESPSPSLSNFDNIIGDTSEVGSFPAGVSPYGAFDMAGNVFEMVADWYDANYYGISPSSNPMGADAEGAKVVRSGSWSYSALDIRITKRNWVSPRSSFVVIGFRCALSQ